MTISNLIEPIRTLQNNKIKYGIEKISTNNSINPENGDGKQHNSKKIIKDNDKFKKAMDKAESKDIIVKSDLEKRKELEKLKQKMQQTSDLNKLAIQMKIQGK